MELRSLVKNRRFLFLWMSETFAVLSFSMFLITISWYMVDYLNLPQYMGLVFAAASLPRMVTMMVGGVLADRIQRSKIMFSAGLGEAFLIGILLVTYLNDWLTFPVLLGVAFCLGALDGFFFPALSSSIPALVQKEELQSANTLIHSTQELIFLIGPVTAGVLMTYYSFAATFGVSMIAMLLHAILVFPPFIQDAKPTSDSTKQSIMKEFREGLDYVCRSSFYKTGILIIIVINFFVFGPIFLSLPLLVKEANGTALHLSFLEGGFSIGSLLATILLLFITLRKNRGKLILFFLFGTLVFLWIFSQMSSIGGLILLASSVAFCGFMAFMPTDVLIQERTDPKLMGRVMSIVFLAQTAFDPVAQTLFSFLMTIGFSVRTLLAVFSVIGLMIAVLIYVRAKHWRSIC